MNISRSLQIKLCPLEKGLTKGELILIRIQCLKHSQRPLHLPLETDISNYLDFLVRGQGGQTRNLLVFHLFSLHFEATP